MKYKISMCIVGTVMTMATPSLAEMCEVGALAERYEVGVGPAGSYDNNGKLRKESIQKFKEECKRIKKNDPGSVGVVKFKYKFADEFKEYECPAYNQGYGILCFNEQLDKLQYFSFSETGYFVDFIPGKR